MSALDDLELLQIEMDLLWGTDGGPELVIASGRAGQRARVGHGVPVDLARTLIAEVDAGQPGAGLGSPPPRLERWRALLADALGLPISLAPGSGPSYLVQDGVAFRPTAPLVRSDGSNLGGLHNANPGNWGADEWSDLLAGRLGPWVMAVQGDRVISICHTPVVNARAAEAGTWTHPDFRGHGHAAATTAEWAALMRPSGRLLFYSTSHTNHSSQAVAARLGLRSIGWLWQLSRMYGESGWTDPGVSGGGRGISTAELRAIAASGKRYSSAAIGEDEHIVWDVVDADAGGPGGANHSCNPNLWMQNERTLCARRDIAAGEELTMDYALATGTPEWRMECRCGTSVCRGVITGNDWQLPELQQRYAGHFSPFINARIARAEQRPTE